MAENVFDIGIGTKVNNEGLEKGLSDAEREILNSTVKQSAAIQEAANKQVKIVKDTEKKKIKEIKDNIKQQIEAIKSKQGIEPAMAQAEINALKETEAKKLNEIKATTKLEIQVIQDAAHEKLKAEQESGKKRIEAVRDANKSSLQSIKDYASEAGRSLTGIDFGKLLVPTAIAGAAIAGLKKLKGAMDEAAAAYRTQEQAEIGLQNAARNNPYLSENTVKQLNKFANEMQRVTGLDSTVILQAQSQLATLNRNQQQIQQIITVAADVAARGLMTFDQAVEELNFSLNGQVRTLGKYYPELKNLSDEALASGRAIEILGKSVSGAAEEALKTGAGSVNAYKNALSDLQKIFGEDWERFTRVFRNALTSIINSIVEARNRTRELNEIMDRLSAGRASMSDRIILEEENLRKLNRQLELYNKYLETGRLTQAERTEIGITPSAININNLKEEIRLQEELIAGMRRRENVEASMLELLGRSRNLSEDLTKNVLDNQIAINRLRIEEAEALERHTRLLVEQAETQAQTLEKEKERQESAAKYRQENQEALDREIAAIHRRAEIEGKRTDSLEVQSQILNAQMQAYENLLSTAKDLIDGTDEAERNTFNNLKHTWALLDNRRKAEERAEEARKKAEKDAEDARKQAEREAEEDRRERLQQISRDQRDIQSQLERTFQDFKKESTRLYDLSEEQKFQDELLKIREKSTLEAIDFEAEYRRKQKETAFENLAKSLDDDFNLTMQRRGLLLEAELEAAGTNELARTRITERFTNERLELEREYENAKILLAEISIGEYAQIERNRLKLIEDERKKAEAETLKNEESDRKARLQNLVKLQQDVQAQLDRIYDDLTKDATRLYNEAEEQRFQDDLLEIRKKSLTDAVNFEQDYRKRQREIEKQNQLADIANNEILQRERLRKILEMEIEAAGDNNEARLKAEEKYNDDILTLEYDLNNARKQLDINYQLENAQLERDRVRMMEDANKEIIENQRKMYQEMLSQVQGYLDAASQLANSISTIWTNNINREEKEKVAANKVMVQSDEERAAKEKRILAEAAQERYKAEMFAWAANVTMATANAAMAVLNALTMQPWPVALASSIVAGILGAAQVATVISAQPKRPTFHEGGVVPGRAGSEQNITALGQEVFMNKRQFQNQMRVTQELANMKTASSGVSMNVNVENTASNKVEATPKMTADGLKIFIKEITKEGFSDGSFDKALGMQQSNLRGINLS